MRKFYLSTYFLFAFTLIQGQSYFPLIQSNKFWTVLHGDGSQICYLSGGDQYFFQYDTVISGVVYQIVYGYPIETIQTGPFCPPLTVNYNFCSIKAFMREDSINKKVFIYDQNNNAEDLLYDFNLSPGDTLKSAYASQGSILVLDSIGTIILSNGAQRRIFYLNNSEFFIEGIGSSQGLWAPISQGIGFWEEPTCVSENNVQLWGDQCSLISSLDQPAEEFNFHIYPNPTNDYIKINCFIPAYSRFKIFDLLGNCVKTIVIRENNPIIDIRDLTSNYYIFYLEREGLIPLSGTFVRLE
jgi:hypothetical protein